MRCVSCEHKVKGKSLSALKDTGGRCPECGHLYVADPAKDGLSDIVVAKVVERVSSAGSVRFAPEHLGYELLRRYNTKVARRKWFYAVGVVLFVIALILLVNRAFVPMLLFVLLAAVAVAVAMKRRMYWDPFGLASRFLEVNRNRMQVQPAERLLEQERGKVLAGLGAAKRIVVCQDKRHAEFLLDNEFHLQHACPVVGPAGYLVDLYPGLMERLARGPAMDVIVLHDFSPQGIAFARSVRELPRWLGRADAGKVHDVGLSARHLSYLRPSLRAPEAEAARHGAQFREGYAELPAVRPARLIAALAESIEDHKPLRLERESDDTDSDSTDSE